MLSDLLEPGWVLAGAPTATPTLVWAPEVPLGPQRTLLQSEAFVTPVKDQVLIYTPESREAIVCKFVVQRNYAIARHHFDLNLQPCKVPDVITP